MTDFSPSLAAARSRLAVFPYAAAFAALPEDTRGHLLAAIGRTSPVDAVVEGMEALWARRAELDAEARALGADLAHQVLQGGFHAKAERADAVLRWLRADLGEIAPDGLPEPPEVDRRFEPPATVEEPEEG